MKKFHK